MQDPTDNAATAVRVGEADASGAVSAHFVNNVLAAAASYIDEDPDQARDVLAELGQFLAYGLRAAPAPATIAQELEHTATYLRLQQARFPERIEAHVGAGADVSGPLAAGGVRAQVAGALEQRLRTVPGPCVVEVRAAGDGLELELRGPEDLVGEALAITLHPYREATS